MTEYADQQRAPGPMVSQKLSTDLLSERLKIDKQEDFAKKLASL